MKHIKKFDESDKSYHDEDYQKQKKQVYDQINNTVSKLKFKTNLSGEEIANIVNNMVKDKEKRDEFWKK